MTTRIKEVRPRNNAKRFIAVLACVIATSQVTFGARGRPTLNADHTTFVADNGQLLRGPYTSSEWGDPAPYDEIAKMKDLGFNAVHIYAECFDKNYPDSGSTAPGYAADRIDRVVQATRDLGLYLTITIGNGANNGNNNYQYAIDFWKFYAPRYANETHVIFEIHNEPMAWGPSYLTGISPAGVMDMEIDVYNTIRQYAPDTPVLLFSYSVLGGTGGTDAALTDIHAFNKAIFGTEDVTWNNIAVGFHGYAGANNTITAVDGLINAGYPCMMTEFSTGSWGGGLGGLDVEMVAGLERLGVSWLTFCYVPPGGVSDDVTRADAYMNRVMNSGLSWTPDYGTFPVSGRSAYGNNGFLWTTPDYNDNTLSGTLRIEAENFDNGGKNVAYHNSYTYNPGGQYRTDETVGIEGTSDDGGGYNVGWIAAGDWLEYTLKVPAAGMYDLRLRVAGTSAGRVQVLAYTDNQSTDGVDLTGEWTLPNSGNWQAWQTVTKSVFLAPGQQRLRINALAAGFNLNWIELSPASTGILADGTYKFVNVDSGLAMDLDDDNNIITVAPSAADSQKWNLRHIGGGQYQVSPLSGNSWDDSKGLLHLSPWWWAASGSSCFIMLPTENGNYRLFSAGDGSPQQPSDSNPPKVEHNSYEYTYTGAAAQQWSITEVGGDLVDGTYKLVARHSDKAMDAYGAQTTNGTEIIQWSYGGGANQKWTLTDTGDGNYKIIGVQSGKALDIYDGDTANGTKVELWDYWGGSMQLFQITATDSGYYRITPNCATGSCLDVSEISTADGAKVQLWQWVGGQNQQWGIQAP